MLPGQEGARLHPGRARSASSGKAFQGETFFTAPNPPFGAVFTYYLKDELKTKRKARQDAEKEADKKGTPIAYPTREELRAEEREEEPAIVLTVTDEDGNVVRRLTGPAKAGFQRVAWDLRFPAANPTRLDAPSRRQPVLRAARGPARRARPLQRELREARRRRARAARRAAGLRRRVARPADACRRRTPPRSWRSSARPRGSSARCSARSTPPRRPQTRLKAAKKALDDTPGAAPALGAEARRIERALDDLMIGLRGDRVLDSRYEPTPETTTERVRAIVGAQWSATVAPTGTSRKAYADAAEAFEKQLATLRTLVVTDLTALEGAMEKAGAPWTPGRVPTWVKE